MYCHAILFVCLYVGPTYASWGRHSGHSSAPRMTSFTRATVFPARLCVHSTDQRCFLLWKGRNALLGTYSTVIPQPFLPRQLVRLPYHDRNRFLYPVVDRLRVPRVEPLYYLLNFPRHLRSLGG